MFVKQRRCISTLSVCLIAAAVVAVTTCQVSGQTFQVQQNSPPRYSQIQTGKQNPNGSTSTQPPNNANQLQQTSAPFYMSGSLQAFRIVNRYGIPGIGGAAMLPNGDIHEMVGGIRRVGASPKVEHGDLWHIGSCSKAMTATVIAFMIRDGLLTKDTTIWELIYTTNLFPEINQQILLDPIYQDVTIEHLLCHRSGINLPGHINDSTRGFENCFPNPTELRWDTMRRVLASPHSGVTGAYQYSNLGYLILGVIIERIKGKPYEQVMRDELFEPLGMTTAAFGMPSDVDLPSNFDVSSIAFQHGYDGSHQNPWVMNPFNAFLNQTNKQPIGHRLFDGVIKVDNYALEPVWNPAGGLYMSLEDMLKFAELQMYGGSGALALSSTLRMQMQSAYNRPDRVFDSMDRWYGWGWLVGFDGRSRVLSHDGSYFRFYTNMTIYLQEEIAIATATNVDGVEPDDMVNSVPGDDAIMDLRLWIESVIR